MAALDPIAALDDRTVDDARALLNRIGSSPANRKTGLSYHGCRRRAETLEQRLAGLRSVRPRPGTVSPRRCWKPTATPTRRARPPKPLSNPPANCPAGAEIGRPPANPWPMMSRSSRASKTAWMGCAADQRISSGTLVRELGPDLPRAGPAGGPRHHRRPPGGHRTKGGRRAGTRRWRPSSSAGRPARSATPGRPTWTWRSKTWSARPTSVWRCSRTSTSAAEWTTTRWSAGLREQAGILRNARFKTADGGSINLSE